jgi:hypothetical protein
MIKKIGLIVLLIHDDYIKSYVEGKENTQKNFYICRDDKLIGVALVDILDNQYLQFIVIMIMIMQIYL